MRHCYTAATEAVQRDFTKQLIGYSANPNYMEDRELLKSGLSWLQWKNVNLLLFVFALETHFHTASEIHSSLLILRCQWHLSNPIFLLVNVHYWGTDFPKSHSFHHHHLPHLKRST